ncbi:MAG TPA: hypothetical protein DCP63_07590 [Bacteroidetes bacterium]|nr:hypothetical protein [Bacteroidota bacterium]
MNKWRGLFLCLLLFPVATPLVAQDVAKVGGEKIKVLIDNEKVRVFEARLKPGEKLGTHSHPVSIAYFMTSCKLRSQLPDGRFVETERKSGEALWREPIAHEEENIGATVAFVLVVEMKEGVQKEKGMMEANRDAIINDLNNLSAQVYQYRIRPRSMGGGHGSYIGFSLPARLKTNRNASYAAEVKDSNLVRFTATSEVGNGTVSATVNQFGVLANWEYTGNFAEGRKAPEVSPGQNRDGIINDLNNLAAMSFQYRIRPKSMGGGEGSYTGFEIPLRMRTNANATYSARVIDGNKIELMAISTHGYGVVKAELDGEGRLRAWTYTDKLQ